MTVTTVLQDDMMSVPCVDTLASRLAEHVRGEIRRHEPMSRHTTFRVGGPADLCLCPVDAADLATMLRILAEDAVPVVLLGNGSNLLVSDAGLRGAVIRLTPHFAEMRREGEALVVGAGAKLARVIHFALAERLSGLESMMGIPGTLGGALVMNAGTDSGAIGDLVASVTFLTATGERLEKAGDQLAYGYRSSALQGAGLIVLEARLTLTPGEHAAIHAKMRRLEEKRTSRQPTRCRTAGSTFKNLEDIAAGKLLDRAGCKGFRIGGAEVSPVHANFIIAHPGATATDIHALAQWMQRRVREEFDRALTLEIELLGDF